MTRLDLQPEAAPVFARLVIAASDLADRGRPTPCQRRPESWVSDNHTERRDAAEACRLGCPLLDLCREYADAQDERYGVLGGRDHNRTPNRQNRDRS